MTRLLRPFAIDLRSLALLRLLLAVALLANLLSQLPDWLAFYSDAGVLPRDIAVRTDGSERFSLYFASGTAAFVFALWLTQCLAALALLFGWHTRTAIALSWLLLLSLQSRNPLVLNAADAWLATLLFWGLWLPLSARAAFDASLSSHSPPTESRYQSWAAAALRLNVLALLLYPLFDDAATLAVLLHPAWGGIVLLAALAALVPGFAWDAVGRGLTLGRGLRVYHDAECAFCRQFCRLLCALLMLPRAEVAPSRDSARAESLRQAHDSWVVIDAAGTAHLKFAAFAAILKASFLSWPLGRLLALDALQPSGDRLYDRVVRHRARLGAMSAWLLRERSIAFLPGRLRRAAALAALLAWIAWIPGSAPWLDAPLQWLRLDVRLAELTTPPPASDGWGMISGRLVDGREVDVLRATAAPDYRRPPAPPAGADRWHDLRIRLWHAQYADQRADYAQYLCRWRNRDVPIEQRLLSLRLVRMLETGEGRDARAEQQVLLRHDCLAPARSAEGLDAY